MNQALPHLLKTEPGMEWSRPLLKLTMAFTVGIGLERLCPWSVTWVWGPTMAGMLWLGLPLISRHLSFRQFSPLAVLLLFSGLGLLAGRSAAPSPSSQASLEPFYDRPSVLFTAEITAPPDFYPDRVRIPLRLHAALAKDSSVPLDSGIILTLGETCREPGTWLPGDRLLVRLTVKRFHNFDNPGGFDYVQNRAEQGYRGRAYLPNDRLMIKLAADSPSTALSRLGRLRGALDRFRQEALLWLQSRLDTGNAAFYGSLLLGYQHLLSTAWQEHLSRTGVIHLLSISGLHLGLVGMAAFWTARYLVRLLAPTLLHHVSDKHIALWPALAATVLYSFISGFGVPPIWRSMLMLIIYFGAMLWYRSVDALSVLALAALVILLIDPNSLGQISFQLSFAGLAAILYLYPPLQRFEITRHCSFLTRDRIWGKLLHPFEEAFWVSLAVNIAVLPLLVYYFHGVSVAGFLANIVLVPLVGFLVIPPGLLSLAVWPVSESLALPVLHFGSWFLSASQSLILWFSRLPWAYLWVGHAPVLGIIGFYGALLLALSSFKPRKKAIGLLSLLVLLVGIAAVRHAWSSLQDQPALRVTLLDVGQGSSTLVRFPTGETMLVDGGGFWDGSFDIGRAVVAPFLWQAGIRELDHVVLSHDHPDHRNGLRFILSHFTVGSFWESGLAEDHSRVTELSSIAEQRRIPIRRLPEVFGEHRIGSSVVEVLHPHSAYLELNRETKDLNNSSLVLRIRYGDTDLILPGDIDQSVERLVFENLAGSPQTILVAPHHGSSRSNGTLLLDRLAPRYMLFSCGHDNGFGFPSPRVLEECRKRGIIIYRTDLHGAIEAWSDGKTWTIQRPKTLK